MGHQNWDAKVKVVSDEDEADLRVLIVGNDDVDLSGAEPGDSLVVTDDGTVEAGPLINFASAHPSPRSLAAITKHSVDDLQTSLLVPYYVVPAGKMALGVNVGIGWNGGVGTATVDWYITPAGHVGAPDPEHRIARNSANAGTALASIVAGALALPEGWSVWAVASAADVTIEALANEFDADYVAALGWDTAMVTITDGGGGNTDASLYSNAFDRFARFQAGYIHNLGSSTVVVQHQVDRGAGPVTLASTSITANSQSAFSSNVIGLAPGEEHIINVVTAGGSVSVFAAVFAP